MMPRFVLSALVLLASLACDCEVTAAKKKPKLPKLKDVQSTVVRHFAKGKDYRPGDLITRDQVKAVLAQIEKKLKWKVADGPAILKQVPGAEEFLPRKLRTKQGRQFMRQAARFPGGYDQMDRLSRLPDGRSILTRLINGPDGHRMIEYFSTSRGGQELARMLSRTPGGIDFNKPTGRIYTEADLLKRLRQSHQAAARDRKRPVR